MKTYEEYKELVLEQEPLSKSKSNSKQALENKYEALKNQYDALISKQEGVEEKKTKAEEGIKVAQAKLEIAQKDLESKQIEAEPIIDQEENIETQIATLEKKIEQLQLTFNRNEKAKGTATGSEDNYGKHLQGIDDKASLEAQGRGLQTNSKHKSLNGFISEGVGIGSDLDLDYAHGNDTDREIHIRFTPKESKEGGQTKIDANVPVPLEKGKVRIEHLQKYVEKNKLQFVTKAGAEEENVKVKLGSTLLKYKRDGGMLPVYKKMIELGISEYDSADGSIVLEIILLPDYKTRIGSKTMDSLADKVQGKVEKIKGWWKKQNSRMI
jgi:hypothetical protein